MTTIEALAAEHGVRTRHQGGQVEVWEEASVLTAAGAIPASGWRPAPETVPAMLAWLGY